MSLIAVIVVLLVVVVVLVYIVGIVVCIVAGNVFVDRVGFCVLTLSMFLLFYFVFLY